MWWAGEKGWEPAPDQIKGTPQCPLTMYDQGRHITQIQAISGVSLPDQKSDRLR